MNYAQPIKRPMFQIVTNVLSTQAYGCQFCLHIGSVALMFGRRDCHARRLELFTPLHRFRYSSGKKRAK